MLCTYNKENQIFILMSTIMKSYLFACNYAGKVPETVECWNNTLYYKDTEVLIYLKKIIKPINLWQSGTPFK